MDVTGTLVVDWVLGWLWPLVRVGAFVAAAPLFGHRSIPVRVKAGVAVVLTATVAPLAQLEPVSDPLGVPGLMVTFHQVLAGLAIGFSLRLVFLLFEVAGQQVAQLMGLGFASMVDPSSGSSTPLVSQVYVIMATLVFLAVDGHLLLVQVLAESFRVLDVSPDGLGRDAFRGLVDQATWLFQGAVVIALPTIAALLTVNLAFGIMTRTAPQLNIFAVGFPVTLIFGFVVMLLTIGTVIESAPDWLDAIARSTVALFGGSA